MSPVNASSSSLEREPAHVFLRRPGGALPFARLLLPEAAGLDLAGLGTLALRFACLDGEAGKALLKDSASFCEVFPLSAMGPGLFLVERRFGRHLVNAMLGRTMPPFECSLSRVEHGMLGGLLVTSLANLGLFLGVQISGTAAPEIASDAMCVQVSACLAGEQGQAWLCATAACLERCWKTSRLWAEDLPMILRLELARTDLPKAEAMAASDGDVVVFDETPALSPSSSWPLVLCYGSRRIDVRLAPDGRVQMDDQTAATSHIWRGGPNASLADRVEIAAEIARPIADSVVSARSDWILLRMGDADWAAGRLCGVDGRLAVRITRRLAG